MNVVDWLTGGLLPAVVVIAVAVGIVALARRRGEHGGEEEPGVGTVRRLYYYGLSFVALVVAASGAGLLLTGLVEGLSGARVLAGSESQLAMGLAMTVVGTPVWLLHWAFAQRGLQRFPGEARALSRKVYLYLVLGVSAALVAQGLVGLLRSILGADDFQGAHVATPLVWGGLWLFHHRVAVSDGEPGELGRTVRRLYVYVTSLYGLVMLGSGFGVLLSTFLGEAYASLFGAGTPLLHETALWDDTTRTAVAVALVGGVWWWGHWRRMAGGDAESVLRQAYIYLFAILGGSVTVVSALSVALFRLLQWFIGSPDAASAAVHFGFFPEAVASLVAGGGLWGYHWALAREESGRAAGGLASARRVYRHLVAALGLGTLATGLVTLFATLVGIAVPAARPELAGGDWWRNPLALAVTLIAVGSPVWWLHWLGLQRDVAAGPPEERGALSRRVFIYAVFGVAVLVALGSLSALLFTLFRGVLEGDLSLEVLRDARWAIGLLLMAGAVSVYYWLVLREDRELAPSEAPPQPARPARKAVTALVPEGARPFVRGLEARLGYGVQLWQRLDPGAGAPPATEAALAEAERLIAEAPGDRVLLVVSASGVEVIPYSGG